MRIAAVCAVVQWVWMGVGVGAAFVCLLACTCDVDVACMHIERCSARLELDQMLVVHYVI